MDIIEVAENILNVSLLDYQKKFLYDLYKHLENEESFDYIPSRGNSRSDLAILCATAIIVYDKKNIKERR